MPPHHNPSEDWLRDVVAQAIGAPPPAEVHQLPGHASVRTYWRVGDPRKRSAVVMLMPPDAPPDEISTAGPPLGIVPFVEVQRYLARIGVRVPELLAWSQTEGYAVLEDLGDETMVNRLTTGGDRAGLYRDAIEVLARLRVRADLSPDPSCIAYRRAYEEELYYRELEHFLDWGLGARGGIALPTSELDVVQEEFRAIARRLAAEGRGFTHRDFQSRNLMVLGRAPAVTGLAVIDFQDALLGPRQYDLVSLLRDSYVALDQGFIQRMIGLYLAVTASLGGPRLEEGPFREVFDLLTVQRKLKDAGRFVYLDRVKGNPDFLGFVPTALGYVREAFARLPELAELQAILGSYVPELTAIA